MKNYPLLKSSNPLALPFSSFQVALAKALLQTSLQLSVEPTYKFVQLLQHVTNHGLGWRVGHQHYSTSQKPTALSSAPHPI
jgi:hypothetical protein